jgi:hypothetical protein
MYEYSRTYTSESLLGRFETVSVVTVTEPELYRLLVPTPLVPTYSSKFVATLPFVHVKATLVPVNVVLGAGVLIAAATTDPYAV